MVETLAAWSAQQLVTYAVAALALFAALDLWRRSARALRGLGTQASRPRRVVGGVLAAWLLVALALTLSPTLRETASALPRLQPALTLLAVTGLAGLIFVPAFRHAFDRVPLEELLSFFYWRAVFGMSLMAFYTGQLLPAAFALPAAIGDAVVTCVMVLLLSVAEARGAIPRRPLLVWNTLGLLDLVNAMVLLATVLRPWALQRGLVVGNYALSAFVVPVFIGIHLHLYARLYRERSASRLQGVPA
jgi:hypothetical protein